jgi:hypothetical protein
LYDKGKNKWYCGPNTQVSWDRPYGKYCQVVNAPLSQGSGEFLLWEFPLAYWMEKAGYDVSYISNVDTHADPAGLMRAKAFISVGHDEYWSRAMYDNMLDAVGKGLNVAFFSGDICWGLIPFLPSSRGHQHRIITRVGKFGPINESDTRASEYHLFKETAPSEGMLIGASSTLPVVGVADWICCDEKNWIFADCGMKNGDRIKNLVGWEWMGTPAPIADLSVVAKGIVKVKGEQGEYASTIYPGPKDNWVFNAATIWWANGLSAPPGYVIPKAYDASPNGPDARVQKITANLFNRFRGAS